MAMPGLRPVGNKHFPSELLSLPFCDHPRCVLDQSHYRLLLNGQMIRILPNVNAATSTYAHPLILWDTQSLGTTGHKACPQITGPLPQAQCSCWAVGMA